MKRGFKYLLLLLVLVFPFSMFADELVIEETHDDYSYYNALLFYNFTVNNNGWSTIDITYNNKVLSYNDAHIYCGENREFCPEEKVTVSNSDKLSIIKNSDLETPIVIEIMFEGIEVGESETKVSVDGVEYKFAEPIKTIVNEENKQPEKIKNIKNEDESLNRESFEIMNEKAKMNKTIINEESNLNINIPNLDNKNLNNSRQQMTIFGAKDGLNSSYNFLTPQDKEEFNVIQKENSNGFQNENDDYQNGYNQSQM